MLPLGCPVAASARRALRRAVASGIPPPGETGRGQPPGPAAPTLPRLAARAPHQHRPFHCRRCHRGRHRHRSLCSYCLGSAVRACRSVSTQRPGPAPAADWLSGNQSASETPPYFADWLRGHPPRLRLATRRNGTRLAAVRTRPLWLDRDAAGASPGRRIQACSSARALSSRLFRALIGCSYPLALYWPAEWLALAAPGDWTMG